MLHRALLPGLALAVLWLSAAACGPRVTPTALPTAAPPTFGSPATVSAGGPVVPPGFRVTLISDQPKIATAFVRAGNDFYVTEFRRGSILRLEDTNGDGLPDETRVFATGFNMPRGLAIHPETHELYVSQRGLINALRDTDNDGVADQNRVVVQGLYDLDFMHSNNGIAFGPDGKLYIADGAPRLGRIKRQGAPPLAGTILTANPDGSDLQIFARGFRNPFGLAFAPDGSLYVTDNGEDAVEKEFQGDELNLVTQGKDYGYPTVLGEPPPGSDTVAPLVNFPADTAPTAVLFYNAAQFPETYRGDILVALWNVGHKIVRVSRDAQGKWQAADFITNLKFPVGMTLGANGELYILDMADGVDGAPGAGSRIYKVEYVP